MGFSGVYRSEKSTVSTHEAALQTPLPVSNENPLSQARKRYALRPPKKTCPPPSLRASWFAHQTPSHSRSPCRHTPGDTTQYANPATSIRTSIISWLPSCLWRGKVPSRLRVPAYTSPLGYCRWWTSSHRMIRGMGNAGEGSCDPLLSGPQSHQSVPVSAMDCLAQPSAAQVTYLRVVRLGDASTPSDSPPTAPNKFLDASAAGHKKEGYFWSCIQPEPDLNQGCHSYRFLLSVA